MRGAQIGDLNIGSQFLGIITSLASRDVMVLPGFVIVVGSWCCIYRGIYWSAGGWREIGILGMFGSGILVGGVVLMELSHSVVR